MERNIEKYLKVYQVLSEEDCIKTVKALEEKDNEFKTHQFYNSTEGTYHSYEHELSVAYSQIETKDLINLIPDEEKLNMNNDSKKGEY